MKSEGRKDHYQLDREGCLKLADALGDTPHSCESTGPLRAGKAKAWVKGSLPDFEVAVVQWDDLPQEPVGFGPDVQAIFEILQLVKGWTCVDVEGPVGEPLGRIFEREWGCTVSYSVGVGYQCLGPVKVVWDPAVRELAPEDVRYLDATAKEEFARNEFHDPVPAAARRDGDDWCHAGAIVDGRLVSFVGGGGNKVSKYGVLGGCTLEAYRKRGFATAAASIVAGYLQSRGFIPTWSTGTGNPASMAVPLKLGFEEVSPRSCYVVPGKRRM